MSTIELAAPTRHTHPKSASGRCRRHTQGTCAGNVRGDLCNRHRTAWKAMVADWQARANNRATVPPVPPQVLWLNGTSDRRTDGYDGGWYFNCEACKTTIGFRHEDDAHAHLVGHVCKPWVPTAPPRKRPDIGEVWTEAEDRILAAHGNTEAMRLTGRTLWSITSRRKKRRILVPTAAKPWTADEDKILRTHTAANAQVLLGRSRAQVDTRRAELGLTRIDMWKPAEEAIVMANTTAEAHRLLPHRTPTGIRNRRRILREQVAA